MEETNLKDHPLYEEREKRAKEIQEKGGWYYPCPDEWLKKKEWSVLSAMLLFAGLDPKYSELIWGTHGKCAEAKHIERLGYQYNGGHNFALLSKEGLRQELKNIRKDAEANLGERNESMREDGVYSLFFSLKDCRDNEHHEACNRWLKYYDESEKLLNFFIEKWLEKKGLHYTEFDQTVRSEIAPVTFFTQWAANNDLTKYIPWWIEADATGLIPSDTNKLAKQDSGDLEYRDLLPFTDHVKQFEHYGKTERDIFNLAIEGELVIYAPVEAVTVLWYIDGTDYHDPQGEIEYRKPAFLPLTRECIHTIAISAGVKVRLHFDCPSSLRHTELTAEEKYTSEIRPLGWLQFNQHEWANDENVKRFSEGDRTRLYVRKEDKERLDTDKGATPTTDFIAYPKAMKILREKWQATPEELAMWIFLGPETGGIAAYQNANELNPPPRFAFAGCFCEDYLSLLMSCWFRWDEVNRFKPAGRYITGAELIERWGKNPSLRPEDFIRVKIAESRLEGFHPTFGITRGTFSDDANLPPLAAGLFALSHIEQIEAEDGLDSNPLLPNSNVEPDRNTPYEKGGRPKSPLTEAKEKINNLEQKQGQQPQQQNEPDTCAAKYPFYLTSDLLTLREAITETGLDVRQLLKFARLDADLLEILFLVDRKNIEQPVSSPEMANLAGDSEYLAVPSENIQSLIDRGETKTQIFRLSKYAPSSVWLLDFRQLLLISGIKSCEVMTISPYKIPLDLDRLKVVRKQIEALPSVKRSDDKHAYEQPTLLQQNKLIKGNSPKKRGPKKRELSEAIEYLYDKFQREGDTEILRGDHIEEFLQLLKKSINEKDQNYSDYVAERIKDVFKKFKQWIIVTQDRTLKSNGVVVIKAKSLSYGQKDVSKRLTNLRDKKPLPP